MLQIDGFNPIWPIFVSFLSTPIDQFTVIIFHVLKRIIVAIFCWFLAASANWTSRLTAEFRLSVCGVFRSSFRGWRWSSARWPETKRSCRGTSWSSPSTRTCWRSRGPSYTAAPEWVCFCSAAHLSHTHTPTACHVLFFSPLQPLFCISGEALPLTSPKQHLVFLSLTCFVSPGDRGGTSADFN